MWLNWVLKVSAFLTTRARLKAITISTTKKDTNMELSSTSMPPFTSSPQSHKLGVVFDIDIDGTLVGESEHNHQWRLRPRTIEFLQMALIGTRSTCCALDGCLWQLGHYQRLSNLPATAWTTWQLLARRIACIPRMPQDSAFYFAWGGSKLRSRKEIPIRHQTTVTTSAPGDACIWCGPYSHSCTRC